MRAVRIETSPFQILSLVEFPILLKESAWLAKISGYISAEEKNRIMAMISEETWAHIWFYDETGGKNIFILRVYRGFENPCRGGTTFFIDGTFKKTGQTRWIWGAY